MDAWIPPLISVVATAISAIFLLGMQRKKMGAEAELISVDAANKVIQTLQAEVARLCQRIDDLEREQQEDRTEIAVLRTEVASLGDANRALRARVVVLEGENKALLGRVGALEEENLVLRAENAELRRPREG